MCMYVDISNAVISWFPLKLRNPSKIITIMEKISFTT